MLQSECTEHSRELQLTGKQHALRFDLEREREGGGERERTLLTFVKELRSEEGFKGLRKKRFSQCVQFSEHSTG